MVASPERYGAAVAVTLIAATTTVGAEPAISHDLPAEPTTASWRVQAHENHLELDLVASGVPVGWSFSDRTRYLVSGRAGPLLTYWGDFGGVVLMSLDVERARALSSRAGLHVHEFRRDGLGFVVGAQSDASDLALAAGICLYYTCLEARELGLFTQTRTRTIALTITLTGRMLLRVQR